MSITQYYDTKELISLLFIGISFLCIIIELKKNIKPLKLIKSARYHISITVFFLLYINIDNLSHKQTNKQKINLI